MPIHKCRQWKLLYYCAYVVVFTNRIFLLHHVKKFHEHHFIMNAVKFIIFNKYLVTRCMT